MRPRITDRVTGTTTTTFNVRLVDDDGTELSVGPFPVVVTNPISFPKVRKAVKDKLSADPDVMIYAASDKVIKDLENG